MPSSEAADNMEPDVVAAPSGGLQVTKAEWEAIEDIPPAVRRVGALFQAAAQELTCPASDALRRTTSVASSGSAPGFDEEAWAYLTGEMAKPAAKVVKKIDQLRRKRLEESLKADKARLTEELVEDRPPRLERYGNRFASFLAAALAWLERKHRPKVLAAVTAARLREAALQRAAELPPTALRRLDALIAGGAPAAALRELCDHEEHLAGAALLDVELTLHADQREFVELVCGAVQAERPLLLRYQTPPSGGKTSSVALLGACLSTQRRRHLIYACYSRQVRVDVGKHLLAASVAFAIVVQGVATLHNSCYHGRPPRGDAPPVELAKRAEWSLRRCRGCDRFPAVLVCDLSSALLLLQQSGDEHVLIFDEPTADVAQGMREEVRRLLRTCPAVTALLSAGVPAFEAMPSFVDHFRGRHPAAQLSSVACERLPMSVTALDAQERIWAPHQFGVSADAIAADGHLLRFYSPRVLEQLTAADPTTLRFADLLSYAAIRAACLRLLRGAAPAAPASSTSETACLELAQLCTKQAWRVPGASLVIVDDPSDFLQRALAPNLADVPSLRRLLKSENQQQRLEARRAALDERRGDGHRKSTKDERQEQRDDALPRSQTWSGEGTVDLWPGVCVINTVEHLTRHAPAQAKAFPTKWLRSALPLPGLVKATSDQSIVEAALCGVLPFGLADAAFEAVAQALAEQARESIALADVQLIFGLNFSLERVVVACRPLSYLDMKQLCGRAGRTGRAAKAEVLFLADAPLRAAMIPPDAATLLASAAANFAV